LLGVGARGRAAATKPHNNILCVAEPRDRPARAGLDAEHQILTMIGR
jgi:hypothetical protein